MNNHPPRSLSVDQCVGLLRAGVVGRVALCTPMGPRIVPVNYAVHGDAIVFRTSPYSEVGTYARDAEVAFEIDHLDYESHTGWSVVALGRAHMVDDAEELREIRATWDPRPWARGQRNLYLRVPWHEIDGRSVGAEWARTPVTPVRRTV